jgi:transposase
LIAKYRKADLNENITSSRGAPRKIDSVMLEKIEMYVETHTTATLKQIKEHIGTNFGINLSIQSIFNSLRLLKITLKTRNLVLDRVNSVEIIEKRHNMLQNFSICLLY